MKINIQIHSFLILPFFTRYNDKEHEAGNSKNSDEGQERCAGRVGPEPNGYKENP